MYVARDACTNVGMTGYRGLGCAGDPTCRCGGSCGMGRVRGLGIFDSSDFTTWGAGEWAIIAAGAYLVLSLAGDVGRAKKTVRRYRASRKIRRRFDDEGFHN